MHKVVCNFLCDFKDSITRFLYQRHGVFTSCAVTKTALNCAEVGL